MNAQRLSVFLRVSCLSQATTKATVATVLIPRSCPTYIVFIPGPTIKGLPDIVPLGPKHTQNIATWTLRFCCASVSLGLQLIAISSSRQVPGEGQVSDCSTLSSVVWCRRRACCFRRLHFLFDDSRGFGASGALRMDVAGAVRPSTREQATQSNIPLTTPNLYLKKPTLFVS